MSPWSRRRWRRPGPASPGRRAEAVAAVDGLVAAWLEGHAGDPAAAGAGHLEELTGATTPGSGSATTTAHACGATRGAARRAARRGVGETARGEELLLSLGPDEVHAALAAPKGLVNGHCALLPGF